MQTETKFFGIQTGRTGLPLRARIAKIIDVALHESFAMTSIFKVLCALFILCAATAFGDSVPPEEALKQLMEGNLRYTKDDLRHLRRDTMRREELVCRQTPFAVILGCSDSRVPLEIIFDQGVGDLFVVRNAGNVVGPVALDSIEYGVLALKAQLILVLGHQNCGAVTAVVRGQTADIEAVASLIEPSLAGLSQNDPELIPKAITANVRHSMETIKSSPVVARLIQEGKLRVVGGCYSLTTGLVTLLP